MSKKKTTYYCFFPLFWWIFNYDSHSFSIEFITYIRITHKYIYIHTRKRQVAKATTLFQRMRVNVKSFGKWMIYTSHCNRDRFTLISILLYRVCIFCSLSLKSSQIQVKQSSFKSKIGLGTNTFIHTYI